MFLAVILYFGYWLILTRLKILNKENDVFILIDCREHCFRGYFAKLI